ncbi:hypothetical protein DYB36_012994 [Aphanomyces astaci]|uniref:Uncharacterized protein n=1 Tax=Aphanomyces astaci TaxID=112090 RepID=A0A396ZXH1_APHAT|nr:hypothetical protein DYB36_012994 [Aphanomyces astaci]
MARLGPSTGGLRAPNVRQALPGFAMGSRPAPAAESTHVSKRIEGLEWKQESASSAEDGQVAEESEEDFGDEPPRSPSDRLPSFTVGSCSRADNFLDGKGAVLCASQLDVVLTAVVECMGRDSGLVKEDLVSDLDSRHVVTAAPIGFGSLSLLGGG